MRSSLLLSGLIAVTADISIQQYDDSACATPTGTPTVMDKNSFGGAVAEVACQMANQMSYCDATKYKSYNWADGDANACDMSSVTTACPDMSGNFITLYTGDDADKPCYLEFALDTCLPTVVSGGVALGYVKITGTCPGMDSGSDVDSDPCFARDTLAISPDGDLVPMASLKSGDLVMDGPNSVARVIVNQHREAIVKSSLLELTHANGELSLTPDHVLEVDGKFVPARLASTGSKLGESEVSRVTAKAGDVINPLTTSGKILTQGGVLASTYPEWIAEYMLSSHLVPLPLSLSLSYLFPETTQAYYDALIEPLVTAAHPKHLKKTLPAPLLPAVFLAGDLALSVAFVAFALASPVAAVAAAAAIAAIVAAKSRKYE